MALRRVFIGGDILPGNRGSLVAIITRERDGERAVSANVYKGLVSFEFRELTSPEANGHEVLRVYAGISAETGDRIVKRTLGYTITPLNGIELARLDRTVAYKEVVDTQ